jgi:hypothetical protein
MDMDTRRRHAVAPPPRKRLNFHHDRATPAATTRNFHRSFDPLRAPAHSISPGIIMTPMAQKEMTSPIGAGYRAMIQQYGPYPVLGLRQ